MNKLILILTIFGLGGCATVAWDSAPAKDGSQLVSGESSGQATIWSCKQECEQLEVNEE